MKKLTLMKNVRSVSETAGIMDVDVTPVMNMFVILIPFLVSMAVFTHLSILKFSLPPNAGADLENNSEKPKIRITVVVASDHLAIVRGESMLDSIPSVYGSYDFKKFTEKLTLHRGRSDIKNEAVIAVKDVIKIKYVVSVMDICRETGFVKLGVSQATENAEKGV
ncbi:MAG: biopolymer transporter ExbD [Chitinispirillia bacterium]|jgi:biopolymer transport protein ExbD